VRLKPGDEPTGLIHIRIKCQKKAEHIKVNMSLLHSAAGKDQNQNATNNTI
jgi:hypothetical protein